LDLVKTVDPRVFGQPRRWWVLGAYSLVLGMSQLLWLNFAPLLSLVQRRYGVGELTASLLVLVFPALYVVFSVPAGAMTDRRGYRFTVGLGAIVMALAAALRIWDGSFWMLLAGQIGIAVAQPFVLNGISKLVADWFSEAQGALATGLGTMGMYFGMAASMAATPALVDGVGLRATMIVCTVAAAAVALAFLVWVHPNPQQPASARVEEAVGFGPLLADRRIVLLCAVSFLGIGVFNGLTTWLEQILAPHGIDSERAGLVGGALIIGGICGAVVIPALSDAARRRKPFLVLCGAVALVTLYPLCTSAHMPTLSVLAALHGFFFLPALALLLEMCAQLAGATSAGAATSLLLLAGNAGGVAVIVAMPMVNGASLTFERAVVLMVALLLATTLLTVLAPETSRREVEPGRLG
jgi:predicted MFS family arabinose efflux permease